MSVSVCFGGDKELWEARQKAIEKCDDETPMKCYCGRLATGFHTEHCSKFQAKVTKYTKEILKEMGR